MKKTNFTFILVALLLVCAHNAYSQLYTTCKQCEDLVIPAGSKWVKKTTAAGFSGTGYVEWTGGNMMATPAIAANMLEYKFTIPKDGSYTVLFRGRRVKGEGTNCPLDAAGDACNDIFTKVDAGLWHKSMIKGTFGAWIWDAAVEIEGSGIKPREHILKAGVHTVLISGRSTGVQLDGVVILPFNSPLVVTAAESDKTRKVECGVTSIGDNLTESLSLSPNPCNDVVTLSNVAEGSTIKLFNSIGAVTKIESPSKINGRYTFSTASLLPGIYFVVVNEKVIKLMKR